MKEITVDAVDDNLKIVQGMISDMLEEADCPPKIMFQVEVSVEEIFVNICHYAYGDVVGQATVSAEVADNKLTLHFVDSGVPFNPLEREEVDITVPAEERAIGGLGIHIVKKKMDETHYIYEDGQNKLTIVKSF